MSAGSHELAWYAQTSTHSDHYILCDSDRDEGWYSAAYEIYMEAYYTIDMGPVTVTIKDSLD